MIINILLWFLGACLMYDFIDEGPPNLVSHKNNLWWITIFWPLVIVACIAGVIVEFIIKKLDV